MSLSPIKCGRCNNGFSIMTWTVEEGLYVCPVCHVKHRMMLEVVINE